MPFSCARLGREPSDDVFNLSSFDGSDGLFPSESIDVWITLLPPFSVANTALLEFGEPVVNTSYSLVSLLFYKSPRDYFEIVTHTFWPWLSSVRDVFEYFVLEDRFRFVLFVFDESYRDFLLCLLVLISISVLELLDVLLSRFAEGDFCDRLMPTWFRRLWECLHVLRFLD